MKLALALAFLPSLALAAPPPVGNEDWEIMAPYVDWVRIQHAPDGKWCCDLSDGRPVTARLANGKWQIFITEQKFPGSAEGWTDVPVDTVLHTQNPTGVPIAWVLFGRVLCFAPANMG